jgi:hypothetical protein
VFPVGSYAMDISDKGIVYIFGGIRENPEKKIEEATNQVR